MIVGVGNDIVFGGSGNDTIFAGGGSDAIFGDEGRGDTFNTFGNADALYGESGNDFLYGGEGADVLYGGGGADIFAIQKGVGEESILGLGSINQGSLTQTTRIYDYNWMEGDYLFYSDNEFADLSSNPVGAFNPLTSFFDPLKVATGVYSTFDGYDWTTLYTEDEFTGAVEVLAHVTDYGFSVNISNLDFVTVV